MRLLLFSDIHGDNRALEELMKVEADYYFAAGDLVNWGRGLERAGPILAKRAERMLVIPGNHESESDTARLCSEFGLRYFHGGVMEVGGYQLVGLGGSSPTPFNTPCEYSEAELSERLSKFAALQPLILVCHCAPKDTPLDRVREGVHAGSSAVREFIDAHQPKYFFCGHIHEAAGAEMQSGATWGRNVGKKGYVLEI